MDAVEFEFEGQVVVVRPPTSDEQRQGRLAYKRGRQGAAAKGAPTQAQARRRINDIWGPAEQAEFERLLAAIHADEALLTAGGLAADEGRAVAERLRRTRAGFWRLRGPRDAIDQGTAESRGCQSQFDATAALCTRRTTGERYFADAGEFAAMRERGHPVAVRAHWALAGGLFGLVEDFADTLPENVYLRRLAS